MAHSQDFVVGGDGARLGKRQGWVAVRLERGRFVSAAFHESFGELAKANEDAGVVGIDMPIGLVDSGLRSADREARAFLAGRAATIFVVPARPVLKAKSYEEACELAQAASGQKISKHAPSPGSLRSRILPPF